MPENLYLLSAIAVTALVTVALRFAPFLIFRRGAPQLVLRLGRVLPQAMIALLVVFCLKNVSFTGGSHGLPELFSLAVVAALHFWKHNTLLSILAGTVVYMLLVQFVFV